MIRFVAAFSALLASAPAFAADTIIYYSRTYMNAAMVSDLETALTAAGASVTTSNSSSWPSNYSGYRLVILLLPESSFNSAQVQGLENFVVGGGRLVVSGDWAAGGTGFGANNSIVNNLMSDLGVSMSLNNTTLSGTGCGSSSTVYADQVTDSVTSTMWISSSTTVNGGTALMDYSGNTVLAVDQPALATTARSPHDVVLSGDVNLFTGDCPAGTIIGSNYTMWQNLYVWGTCADADGDGALDDACGGNDCDDSDATIYPDASEICDSLDNDCDGQYDEEAIDELTWYQDSDNDTYGSSSRTLSDCDQPSGYVSDDSDCDDFDSSIYPGATEYCDSDDNDCDSAIDEHAVDAVSWYRDSDGDDYGDALATTLECDEPTGYTSDATDCDDTDATIYPGASEVPYDGIDQDCDGADVLDYDGDGADGDTVGGTDCADADPDVYVGATETADGVDEDCDGIVDEGTSNEDADGDGYSPAGGDCDDADASVTPGAAEDCDSMDDDCDGTVDEGTDCYDDDADGYTEDDGDCSDGDADVNPGESETLGNGVDDDCDGIVDDGAWDPDADGYTAEGGDCDETDGSAYPGAPEEADGVDDDCDGIVDEGSSADDQDGDGYSPDDGDCNDDDASVNPDAEETANGVDDDCDGQVDGGTDRSDDDGDGFTEEAGDCDDTDPDVHPGTTETEDGVDEDCDDAIDEGFYDADGDGFGTEDGDCNDQNGWMNPGQSEMCDAVDNDCDDAVDEGCDEEEIGLETDEKASECGCAATPSDGGGAGLLALMAGLVGLRRRSSASQSSGPATSASVLSRRSRLPRAGWLGVLAAFLFGSGCGSDVSVVGQDRRLEVSPGLVDAGVTAVGYSVGVEALIANTGAGDVEIVAVEIVDEGHAAFSWPGDLPLVVLEGESVIFELRYAPDQVGFHTAEVTLVSNASEGRVTFEARGQADIPSVDFWPLALDFGVVPAGFYGTRSLTVANDSALSLEISSASTDHTGFVVDTPLPVTLDPESQVMLDVLFNSLDEDAQSGFLSLDLGTSIDTPNILLRANDCENGSPEAYDVDQDGVTTCGGDCDDSDRGARPGATELADGDDDDCDSIIDEGTEAYDDDGDGWTELDGDCNDGDPNVSPGTPEQSDNGIDDDCDGIADDGGVDPDWDGYSEAAGDCAELDPTIFPGAPELSDSLDNDCDSRIDEGTETGDDDGDGMTEAEGDCDDSDATVYTGASEQADHLDDDCDGIVDEGTIYADDDGDGYTEQGGDCDDDDPSRNPGEVEIVGDGVDGDCDGIVE